MNNEESNLNKITDWKAGFLEQQERYTRWLSEKDAEIQRLKEEAENWRGEYANTHNVLQAAELDCKCRKEEIQQLKEGYTYERMQELITKLREAEKRQFYCHETDKPTCEHQCANCTRWYMAVLSKCDPEGYEKIFGKGATLQQIEDAIDFVHTNMGTLCDYDEFLKAKSEYLSQFRGKEEEQK